ncbi:MAG: alanine racemase [Candidatus Marinimicrobia bacterium CG08_land_8_20_14_0_20_45_22]|nr:MAG: alanine racemase [Candidatus Marinimicrobia bacterium CG08_land_8_20_14_0_20_45_22]
MNLNSTYAEINLGYLAENLIKIQKQVAPAEILAVVKADAYGHGAVPVSRKLQEIGVRNFAVARLAEAIELKTAGINENILIFGGLMPEEIEECVARGIITTLTNDENYQDVCRAAQKLSKTARVHIKIDTGMGRVGFPFETAVDSIRTILENPRISVEGIYSHFATADSKEKSYAFEQLRRFWEVRNSVREFCSNPPKFHLANSGAILDIPDAYFDMVRPGICLYGHYPTNETTESIHLKQVMTLKTVVSQIRMVSKGTPISYGCRYVTEKDTRIAVLPIGYADGIHRTFTNKGQVMIRGKRYPIVGAVTMDQIMIDLGDSDVRVGDVVIFWGNTPEGVLQATEVAERVGTISYELCCSVSKRVPRIYIDETDN